MQQILSRTAVKSVISNQVYIHLEWMKPIEKRIQIGIGCVDKKTEENLLWIPNIPHIHPMPFISLQTHQQMSYLG